MHKVKTGKEEKQYTYTFDAKQYLQKKQVVVCDDKYEMVKLNTVMKFMPKSKRNSSFANENGKYNFYTSSYVIKKCDTADYKEHTIIIGDGGDANIKIDNCFSCSSHNHLLQPSDNEYYILYIYSYIYSHMDTLRNGFSGSVIKNIQKHYLENLLIPIPKTPKLLKQWSTKLSNAYNLIQTNKQLLVGLEGKVKLEVKRICEDEKCEDVSLGSICIFMQKSKRAASYGEKDGKYNFYTSSNTVQRCDEADYNDEHILIGTGGNSSIHIDRMFSCSGDNLILRSETHNMTVIYYSILMRWEKLLSNMHGSTIKHVTKSMLSDFKVRIPTPTNEQLIKNLEKDFKKIKTLKQEIKDSDIQYKQVLQELSSDINLETSIPNKENNSDDIKEQNIFNASQKNKKIIKEENNYTSDIETKHIISDEPIIKKKTKKIVKEHNSNDEKDTNHTVSDELCIKTKKIIKKEYDTNNHDTKHIVSDESSIKKKTKKNQ